MMALIRNELFKLFRMKKTYVFFVILFVMTVVPVYYFLHPESGVMTIVEGANAQALPLVLLASLAQFLGIFMAIYVAEILTDEYKNGTLKLSMMRSAGRIRLLYSKVAAVMAFNAIMLAFSLLITYIVGIIAFGWGENFIFNGATYSTGEGLWMTLSAYAVSLIPYMGFGMMAVFISILMVIFVAVFIADIWVDEYKSGALKMTLLRPVNRSRLLNAKVASLFCSSAAVIAFVLVSSYIVGTAAFGWGESTILHDAEYSIIGNTEYSTLAGIALTLKAGAATLFPVLGFGFLVMFLALCTDSLGMTIGGALGFALVSKAIIRKYSVFYLMRAFYKNLLFGFTWNIVLENVAVIALYTIIFYTGSRLLFGRKDLVA